MDGWTDGQTDAHREDQKAYSRLWSGPVLLQVTLTFCPTPGQQPSHPCLHGCCAAVTCFQGPQRSQHRFSRKPTRRKQDFLFTVCTHFESVTTWDLTSQKKRVLKRSCHGIYEGNHKGKWKEWTPHLSSPPPPPPFKK